MYSRCHREYVFSVFNNSNHWLWFPIRTLLRLSAVYEDRGIMKAGLRRRSQSMSAWGATASPSHFDRRSRCGWGPFCFAYIALLGNVFVVFRNHSRNPHSLSCLLESILAFIPFQILLPSKGAVWSSVSGSCKSITDFSGWLEKWAVLHHLYCLAYYEELVATSC